MLVVSSSYFLDSSKLYFLKKALCEDRKCLDELVTDRLHLGRKAANWLDGLRCKSKRLEADISGGICLELKDVFI